MDFPMLCHRYNHQVVYGIVTMITINMMHLKAFLQDVLPSNFFKSVISEFLPVLLNKKAVQCYTTAFACIYPVWCIDFDFAKMIILFQNFITLERCVFLSPYSILVIVFPNEPYFLVFVLAFHRTEIPHVARSFLLTIRF